MPEQNHMQRADIFKQAVEILILVAFAIVAVGAGLYRLENIPPLWWDEGWTLNVARNWVETGHYGQIRAGEPQSAGLSASFVVIAPIALSFKLFGVGIWQGRIVGMILTWAALGLIYLLARQLFNRSVAILTLTVLLLLYGDWPVQTIFWGRQVLGEMPLMGYLLAGYVFFLAALRRSKAWLLAAALFWGLALQAKLQVVPFWMLSMFAPLLVTLFRQQRNQALAWLAGMGGSVLVAILLTGVERWIIGADYIPKDIPPGLFQATAVVLVPLVRQQAWERILAFGLSALLGLSYGGWSLLRYLRQGAKDESAVQLVKLAFFILAVSWYAWYALLAIWWERYFFPSIFLSSIFVAAFLLEATNRFSLWTSLVQALQIFFPQRSPQLASKERFRSTLRGWVGLIVFVWIPFALTAAIVHYGLIYIQVPDSSPQMVAAYLEANTPPDALIETYESEIMFLTHRAFHYPPDSSQVELQSPTYFGIDMPFTYDPLAADPDYLVTGPYSEAIHKGRIYDAVLATGEFRLVASFPAHWVYERVR